MELLLAYPAPSLLTGAGSWPRDGTGALVTEREGTSLARPGVLGKSQVEWKLQPDMLRASNPRPLFSRTHLAAFSPVPLLLADTPRQRDSWRPSLASPQLTDSAHHQRKEGGRVARGDSASCHGRKSLWGTGDPPHSFVLPLETSRDPLTQTLCLRPEQSTGG